MRYMRAIAAALTAAVIAPGAHAEAPGLPGLLRYMPAQFAFDHYRIFSYVDFRAIEAAAGLPESEPEPGNADGRRDTFASWPQERQQAWRYAMRRLMAGPDDLISLARLQHRLSLTMWEATGIDFFVIDQAIALRDYPDPTIAVMVGDGPMTAHDDLSRLTARGYVQGERAGVPVWHRHEDDAFALTLIDEASEADPFDAELIRAVRLAFLPDTLILTRNWRDMDMMFAMHAGTAPASPVAELIETMVAATRAVDGVGGRVLQAWATPVPFLIPVGQPVEHLLLDSMDEAGTALPDLDQVEALIAETRPTGDPLPAYPLALFVDLQAGTDQVHAIALPFIDRSEAERAAQVLADRLSSWTPPNGPDDPVVTAFDAQVESLVVEVPDIGAGLAFAFLALGAEPATAMSDAEILAQTAGIDGAIAVVAVRYPMPATMGPLEGTPARILLMWLQGIISRDLTLLAVP